jgi:hypothetical protein
MMPFLQAQPARTLPQIGDLIYLGECLCESAGSFVDYSGMIYMSAERWNGAFSYEPFASYAYYRPDSVRVYQNIRPLKILHAVKRGIMPVEGQSPSGITIKAGRFYMFLRRRYDCYIIRIGSIDAPLCYVHELQQALRLAGVELKLNPRRGESIAPIPLEATLKP